ncbi:MAG: tetratricopeptide repeat protein [Kiritimatiellae bacterium]|nr:tetratricopeptide repeat protein [Kiritimatiellia bacterium]
MKRLRIFMIFALVAVSSVCMADVSSFQSGVPRYATDAYPGFDIQEGVVVSEKKKPKWFAFLNGPEKDTPFDQLQWAVACESEGAYRKARKGYDALVRNWPSSPEAPVAQERLADLELSVYENPIQAFTEYKYLLDYYSAQCDYSKVVGKMYDTARRMQATGKNICFIRFENRVETRHAYEAVVFRAPGASFAPAAMLAAARLRKADGEYDKAVLVYETLQNAYPDSEESRYALVEECETRMKILDLHGYNRTRAVDTVNFLRSALRRVVDQEDAEEITRHLAEASAKLEDEAFASAKFYDSRTRTKRNARNAYGEFLKANPEGRHAEEARARLDELAGETPADTGDGAAASLPQNEKMEESVK